MKWLIYGYQGWIGSYFCDYIQKNFSQIELIYSSSRADSIEDVSKSLDKIYPDRVLSFIGRTSGPGCNNISYLEGKLKENIQDNLYSPLVLMKLCADRNIHFTYLGTGCIFSYEKDTDEPFNEKSLPNYFGNSYSTVKGFTDIICRLFTNVLNVRIRMPIVSYDHSKNLLSKIIRYPKINNALNSITVLDDAIPALIPEIIAGVTGTINLVNPDPIDHSTILDLYKKYINPNHTYELILDNCQRANNTLVPSLNLPSTKDSIEKIFQSNNFVI
jgi:3,5-epimerase/4-reductase